MYLECQQTSPAQHLADFLLVFSRLPEGVKLQCLRSTRWQPKQNFYPASSGDDEKVLCRQAHCRFQMATAAGWAVAWQLARYTSQDMTKFVCTTSEIP